PIEPIVNAGYNTGMGYAASVAGGWGRGASMNQNRGQNRRQFGKRIYVPNVLGIQQKGPRPRLDSTGPVAAVASINAPKQE
ncbi:MAG: hypothetical protein EZS28_045461, partial [Streblomastix strix]